MSEADEPMAAATSPRQEAEASAADENEQPSDMASEFNKPSEGELVGSAAMRPVFLGNLDTNYIAENVKELFERPIAPPDAPPGTYTSVPVDRVDLKRGYCFVFLKDALTQADKTRAESFVSEINGMVVDGVSNALRAEFARGDGRVKRKEDDRRKKISPSETLFVVNFHEETTKREDLQMLFEPFGELVRIDMKRNYAFVQFRTIEEAQKAKEVTNGGKLDQSVLTVEYVARQRGENGNRRRDDRRGGGGRDDRGGGGGRDDRGGGGRDDRGGGGGRDDRGGGGGRDDRGGGGGRDDRGGGGGRDDRGGYRGGDRGMPPNHRGGGGDRGMPPPQFDGNRGGGGGGGGGYRGGRDDRSGDRGRFDDRRGGVGGRGGGNRDRSPPRDRYRARSRSRSRSPPGRYRSRSPAARRDHYEDYRRGSSGGRDRGGGRSPDRDHRGGDRGGDRGYRD